MKEKSPVVFKLDAELHARLEECSKRLRVKKYSLGIMALEAVVKAIEKNGYKLVIPIEFDVAEVPGPAKPQRVKYPPHRPSHLTMTADPSLNEPSSVSPASASGSEDKSSGPEAGQSSTPAAGPGLDLSSEDPKRSHSHSSKGKAKPKT